MSYFELLPKEIMYIIFNHLKDLTILNELSDAFVYCWIYCCEYIDDIKKGLIIPFIRNNSNYSLKICGYYESVYNWETIRYDSYDGDMELFDFINIISDFECLYFFYSDSKMINGKKKEKSYFIYGDSDGSIICMVNDKKVLGKTWKEVWSQLSKRDVDDILITLMKKKLIGNMN